MKDKRCSMNFEKEKKKTFQCLREGEERLRKSMRED